MKCKSIQIKTKQTNRELSKTKIKIQTEDKNKSPPTNYCFHNRFSEKWRNNSPNNCDTEYELG